MISQNDVAARLRLFRYGLIVIVVVTFMISMLAPAAALSDLGSDAPPITDFLGNALVITLIVAVMMVVMYFGYAYVLKKTVGDEDSAQVSQTPAESSAD